MAHKSSTHLVFICLIAILCFNCSNGQSSAKEFKILFVGNSLTYTNNLPKLVEEKANDTGIKVTTKMLAFPNYALEDHLNGGQVQKLIKKNNYDFIIIQQGPSSQPYGLETLIDYGKNFKELCDKYDAQLVYFMVWPSRQYYQTFQGVIENHKVAAKENNALLCPVGKVWKDHFDVTNDYDYYGNDGFHPSFKGSLVAAKIIVESLFPNQ